MKKTNFKKLNFLKKKWANSLKKITKEKTKTKNVEIREIIKKHCVSSVSFKMVKELTRSKLSLKKSIFFVIREKKLLYIELK